VALLSTRLRCSVGIRTHDFDLNGADPYPARHSSPRIARELKRINGVRNHSVAKAEVILRDRVADAIARIIKRLADHFTSASLLFKHRH
jgi:hypothetical protein